MLEIFPCSFSGDDTICRQMGACARAWRVRWVALEATKQRDKHLIQHQNVFQHRNANLAPLGLALLANLQDGELGVGSGVLDLFCDRLHQDNVKREGVTMGFG